MNPSEPPDSGHPDVVRRGLRALGRTIVGLLDFLNLLFIALFLLAVGFVAYSSGWQSPTVRVGITAVVLAGVVLVVLRVRRKKDGG